MFWGLKNSAELCGVGTGRRGLPSPAAWSLRRALTSACKHTWLWFVISRPLELPPPRARLPRWSGSSIRAGPFPAQPGTRPDLWVLNQHLLNREQKLPFFR